MVLVRGLLILSLILGPIPTALAEGDPTPPSWITRVRIVLLASDEEMPHVREALEEVEHALEPPMAEAGFLRRKWETIKNPLAALDLIRSFQNIARVVRVSKNFESPWLRDLIVGAATMFSITHGGEVVTGTTMAIKSLLEGDLTAATAWIGLALPGLYDFGCYAGAGILIFRPTRDAYHSARKYTFSVVGKTAQRVGLPAVMHAFFENRTARERLAKLLQSREGGTLEVDLTDAELTHLTLRTDEGVPFARLTLEENELGDLVLKRGVFDTSRMPGSRAWPFYWAPNSELRSILKGLGWNIRGAVLTLSRLIRQGAIDRIQYEKSFVSAVKLDGEELTIDFRPEAVALSHQWVRRQGSSTCADRLLPDPEL